MCAPEGHDLHCRRRAHSLVLGAIDENRIQCICAAEPLNKLYTVVTPRVQSQAYSMYVGPDFPSLQMMTTSACQRVDLTPLVHSRRYSRRKNFRTERRGPVAISNEISIYLYCTSASNWDRACVRGKLPT